MLNHPDLILTIMLAGWEGGAETASESGFYSGIVNLESSHREVFPAISMFCHYKGPEEISATGLLPL